MEHHNTHPTHTRVFRTRAWKWGLLLAFLAYASARKLRRVLVQSSPVLLGGSSPSVVEAYHQTEVGERDARVEEAILECHQLRVHVLTTIPGEELAARGDAYLAFGNRHILILVLVLAIVVPRGARAPGPAVHKK